MKRLVLIALASLSLTPTLLRAALPPSAYQRARETSAHHVQIAISRVTPPQRGGEIVCEITGRVVTVFKGSLRVGQTISVHKSCDGPAIGQATAATPLPPGPQIYVQTSVMQRARYIEVFLANDPLDIISDQAVIIPAPSPRPRCNASALTSICIPTLTR
jgi:hypothetical protein